MVLATRTMSTEEHTTVPREAECYKLNQAVGSATTGKPNGVFAGQFLHSLWSIVYSYGSRECFPLAHSSGENGRQQVITGRG